MTGPQGETVSLGNTFVAQNAAFKAGQHGASGIDLSMPYTAPLAQKLAMIFQQDAAIAGQAAPQLSMTSSTPIQLPAALGQCGRFVGDISGQQGAMKLMAIFCSLPLDSRGAYKNIMLYAQAPPSVAAESAPTAQAVFQSYRIPAAWLQKKLSPQNQLPKITAAVRGDPFLIRIACARVLSQLIPEVAIKSHAGRHRGNCHPQLAVPSRREEGISIGRGHRIGGDVAGTNI
jgi:hypothetical protein